MLKLTKVELAGENKFMFIITDDVKQEDIPVIIDEKELFQKLSEAFPATKISGVVADSDIKRD